MKTRIIVSIFIGIGVVIVLGLIYIWMNLQAREPIVEINPLIETGQVLYTNNCLSCHGDQQATMVFGQPPPHNADGHTWHHADGELKKWILNGKPYNMPAFEGTLTESDVDAILAFLKTWWEPSQRKTQAGISERYREMMERYPQDQ